MNKDAHILGEAYKFVREQQFAKFVTSQSSDPKLGQFNVSTQQGITPSLTKMNSAMQSVQGGVDRDNMKADRLIDELIQDMQIDAKYKGELIKLAISLAQKSAAEKK